MSRWMGLIADLKFIDMNQVLQQPSLLQFPNGDRFEGQTAGPNAPLQGTYLFGNGDRYKGSFKEGCKHGHGTYNYTSTG